MPVRDHVCANCMWFAIDRNQVKQTEQATEHGMRIQTYKTVDGFCRRNAPIRQERTGETQWEWPIVMTSDWCGEWKWNEGFIPR